MIKAAFFDIDGTLVSFRTHDVPASAVRALEELRRRGVKLFLATGRSASELPDVVKRLDERGCFDGFLTFNGQYCYDADGKVFRDHPIPADDVRSIVELVEGGAFDVAVMLRNRIFVNRKSSRVRAAERHVDAYSPLGDVREALEEPVYQFCVYIAPGEEHVFTDACTGIAHARWCEDFCDVIPADGGKPAGIAAVLERTGIAPEECVAFGDSGNDVPMFGCVGTSVAMGNASDEVKAAATMVAPDIDEDGIWTACCELGLV